MLCAVAGHLFISLGRRRRRISESNERAARSKIINAFVTFIFLAKSCLQRRI
jgi:hypothetical protein